MSSVRVRYQTFEFGDTDIHLRTLRDDQQFQDAEHIAEDLGISSASWPHFGVVWESGEMLARLMHTLDIRGLKVLEVGCGIGLASIVLGVRHADITATDHHPEAEAYMDSNAVLNGIRPIPFVRTGWEDTDSRLGRFDVVIGSDLLYEALHVNLLADFILGHTNPRCQVTIIDPGRGLHGKFTRRMVEIGYTHDSTQRTDPDIPASYTGHIMRFSRVAGAQAPDVQGADCSTP